MTCPFCGLQFDPGAASAVADGAGGAGAAGGAGGSCAPCPLRRLSCGRRIACCPRCGYQTPLPPRWLRVNRKEPVHGAE